MRSGVPSSAGLSEDARVSWLFPRVPTLDLKGQMPLSTPQNSTSLSAVSFACGMCLWQCNLLDKCPVKVSAISKRCMDQYLGCGFQKASLCFSKTSSLAFIYHRSGKGNFRVASYRQGNQSTRRETKHSTGPKPGENQAQDPLAVRSTTA